MAELSHKVAPPFAHSSGPQEMVKLALVGEAWGSNENIWGRPFVGASGQELTRMLQEAGIARRECFLTNVFALQPPANDLLQICVGKKELPEGYALPPLSQGKYIEPQYAGELDRLHEELTTVKPNLIVALGASACWALIGSRAISEHRGTVVESSVLPGVKVLPTYHPAAVLRNWAYRPIVVADLMKARLEQEFAEIRRPRRFLEVAPTLPSVLEWNRYEHPILAADIETTAGQITMIGFACSRSKAIVIPFWDRSKPNNSYWETPQEERLAWRVVQEILEGPALKIFQNGIYDLQYIYKTGIRPRNCLEDTMLLHHSIYPELQKGLGFLGSIYCNEQSWKLMRRQGDAKGATSTKRDE